MTIHRIATSRRPSPSMVLSLIALFVALGGTSYAAVKINGKNIKQDTVTGKQVKERSLGKVPNARAADAAASATTAGTATNATNATNAINAVNATHAQDATTAGNAATVGGKSAAELASPAAFAYVDASTDTPAVPAGQARGMTAGNVTKAGSFVCINGLPFEPAHVQVTTYRVGGGLSDHIANAQADDTSFCPGNEQAAVQMVDASASAPATEPRFYIALFR